MWVLASLNRVARVISLLEAMRATGVSTPGVVILGPDQAGDLASLPLPEGWTAQCQHPDDHCLTQVLNRFLREHPDHEWYGQICDDNIPVTFGWDTRLIEQALKSGIASCDDGWQAPRRMHSATVWRGDVLRCAEFWQPPMVRHSCADDFWEEIGRRFGIWTCLMDVRVEHHHPLKHGDVLDATYARQMKWLAEDVAEFKAWRAGSDYAALICRFAKLFTPTEAQAAQARLDRARSRRPMICTPVARSPALEYTISYADTGVHLERTGIQLWSHFVIGSSNLPRARNELVARFLASQCSDLIFVDDDMGWRPEAVVRLLASEKPVIAGVGRKRVDKPNSDRDVWCVSFLEDAQSMLNQDAMGAIEVEAVGTAFMKIERGVFETLIAAHPEWKRDGHDGMSAAVKEKYYRFFKFNDETEGGEDFLFCHNWRALGGKVFIDPMIWLSHAGGKAWSGCIAEMLQPVAQRLEAAE
jgi:hypothetical protein